MRIDLTPNGVSWSFNQTVESWFKDLPIQAAAAVNDYLSDRADDLQAKTLHVPAATVASWSATVAQQMGLPPNVPLAFDIRLTGTMGRPGAHISVRWLQPGKSIPARDVVRNGLWLTYQDKNYRINSPIYDVLTPVELFNESKESSVEDQFRLWLRIREALGETLSTQLTDGFLRSFRVITASALTFSIRTDAHGDVQLDPVLLTDKREDSGENLQKVPALSEVDEELFPRRLDQLREGVPAFPLSKGTYVVADEPLQRALAAVRQLRQAPAEQRKRAAMHPEAVIREIMGSDESDPTVFVETEKFSDRVRDVGEWTAPVLPWIKISPLNWGAPSSGGIRISGMELPMDEPTVVKAVKDIQAAITQGKPTVTIAGQQIPATAANEGALKQLHIAMTRFLHGVAGKSEDLSPVKNVLIIETNFEEASFTRTSQGKRPGDLCQPNGLKTTPKKHQE